MPTLIRYTSHPADAKHRVTDRPLLWCTREGEKLVLEGVSPTTTSQHGILEGDPVAVAVRLGVKPDLSLPVIDDTGDPTPIPDRWHRRWTQIFAYSVVAPTGSELEWVRNFVRGPERSDTLPESWSEEALTDGSRDHTHSLCTYRATVEVARGMKWVQRASNVQSHIEAGVAMVQRVRDISAFSGWRSASDLPAPIAETLYEPGDVYQLVAPQLYDPANDPDSEDPRGEPLSQSDLLDAYGLTLL